MAAVNSSPNGFSYAQAAKGRAAAASASQNQANKATTGAATPANTTLPDLTQGGNWADDVEASVSEKAPEAQKAVSEQSRPATLKDSAVERAKSESRGETTESGVPSPDLAASASTTTKDDDSSTAPTNGSSSETTWDSKSQGSEPAWIAERNARQLSSQANEQPTKPSKKNKDKETSLPPPPKPVYHEAAVPTVNVWAKRAQENSFKQPATPQQSTRPAPSTVSSDPHAIKENQRPRADSRKKATSVAGVSRNGDGATDNAGDAKKPGNPTGRRNNNDVRITPHNASSKVGAERAGSTGPAKGVQTHASLPNLSTVTSLVNDTVSWPTPDTVQDKDRKEAVEKENAEKQPTDATPTAKSHKKPQWQSMVVTPNIIFETQISSNKPRDSRGGPNGERGDRSGRGSARGRGGFRGNANGGGPNRVHATQGEEDSNAARGRTGTSDREAMPPPQRPNRASSANSFYRQNAEAERNVRGNNVADLRPYNKASKAEGKATEDRKASSAWKETHSPVQQVSSPVKFDGNGQVLQDEVRIPEPIPRRTSIGTQTEGAEQADGQMRDGPPVRLVPSDSRKEARSFDGTPHLNGPSRGGKRGGRGRGGSREFVNGHQANHVYVNGDFGASPYNGVPASPSSYQRGNQFQYSQQGRGGWSRGNPRAQSIPMEGYYGRYNGPYGQQMQTMPAYMPGIYEYGGYPMAAMPFSPYVMEQQLLESVSMQLEYYFSMDNLLKDLFLRKHMDSQGFVFLDFIAGFNRVKQLTVDKDVLRTVCLNSDSIEIRVGEDNKERLRRREGWEQFCLPKEQRELVAQNDGPKQLQRPERPQTTFPGAQQYGGPAQNGMPPRFDRRSYDGGYPMMNGLPPPFVSFQPASDAAHGDMVNGDDARGRSAKSPIHENNSSANQASYDAGSVKDSEPDAFPDEQTKELTVFVRMNQPRPHNAAARTFSNGSIDSRSIFGELEKKKQDEPTAPATNGDATPNGVGPSAETSRQTSPDAAHSPDNATSETQIQWSKDTPTNAQDGVTGEAYRTLRSKALGQRDCASTGTCPYDLDVLYQFWAHFLLRNFNSKMYNEFRYFADDDGRSRHSFVGLQNLLQFYDHAILSQSGIRDSVIQDYVKLVKDEPAALDGVAFKQLRSAWRNGAMALKNRKKLADLVDGPLKERLEA